MLVLSILIAILLLNTINQRKVKETFKDKEALTASDTPVTNPPISDDEATIRAQKLLDSEVNLINKLEPYYNLYATIIGKYYMNKPLREVEDEIVKADKNGEIYPLSQAQRAIKLISAEKNLSPNMKMKQTIDILPISVKVYQTTVEFLIEQAKELLKDIPKRDTSQPTSIGEPSRSIKLQSKTIKIQTNDYAEYLKTLIGTAAVAAASSTQPTAINLYQIMKSRDSRYSELTSMNNLLIEAANIYSKLSALESQLYSSSQSSIFGFNF